MNHEQALEALKQGKRVAVKDSKYPNTYCQMFQDGNIWRMKQISACAAEPRLPFFTVDIWLYFAKFDEWLIYEG